MTHINMTQIVIKALVVAATIMISVKLGSSVSLSSMSPTVDDGGMTLGDDG